MSENNDPPEWLLVILGFTIAVVVCLIGFFAGTAAGSKTLVFVFVGVVPALAIGMMSFALRRRAPALGAGLLLGGCFSLLLTGLCSGGFGLL